VDLLSSLNPEQQAAVVNTDGPLLILAGAGSGKTRVIAHRIAYLVSQGLSEPDRILAVTFTNKAAEEMRSRVEALLGVDCRQMWVSTFHALCARLLRREAPHIGLSRDFVIYDSTDQLTVVKQALKSLGIDDGVTQPRAALSRISHAKNRMEGPAVFSNATWNPREQQIAKIYELYTKALKDANALDFDDLLLKTVELFEQSEQVRERYSKKFRYLMVDEYQDTNRPQYLLIQRLAAAHRNLCVVGDPDQSIYKWRGADLRNILDFENDFPEARIVKLERNYRSTQVILDAATAVISQNRNRKESASIPTLPAARESVTTAPVTTSTRGSLSREPHGRRFTTITKAQSRSCIERTRSRERSKTHCAEAAQPTRSSAVSGSTSARKSKTRWRISS